ncbi:cupin domain-containing protein [Paenibacillus sp. GCM10027627]|uniref:cupin domain-containing protein n=1 Tax=unclassified Paenibacillus TaxID=185978 RepID=UPI003640BB5E
MAELLGSGYVGVEAGESLELFLDARGVYYERWEVQHKTSYFEQKLALSDAEKSELLHLYQNSIADFAARKGYTKWDIVILSEQTPDMLIKFGSAHYHLEDEVRVVLGGAGIFTIKEEEANRTFELKASPGDVVVIPAQRPHAFRLSDQPQFIVVRLFEGEASSITYPVDDLSFAVK